VVVFLEILLEGLYYFLGGQLDKSFGNRGLDSKIKNSDNLNYGGS